MYNLYVYKIIVTGEYTKNCDVCGKEFITDNINHKLCSDECRHIDRWIGKCNKVIYKTCKTCGKEFTINSSQQNVCSKAYKAIPHGCKYDKTCEICGKEFTTNQVKQKMCSEECRHIYKNIGKCSKVFYRTCEVCNKGFTANNDSIRCCSDECKKVDYKISYKYKYEKYKDKASKSNRVINKNNYNDIVSFTVKELIRV